jgi:hypothetical protein
MAAASWRGTNDVVMRIRLGGWGGAKTRRAGVADKVCANFVKNSDAPQIANFVKNSFAWLFHFLAIKQCDMNTECPNTKKRWTPTQS